MFIDLQDRPVQGGRSPLSSILVAGRSRHVVGNGDDRVDDESFEETYVRTRRPGEVVGVRSITETACEQRISRTDGQLQCSLVRYNTQKKSYGQTPTFHKFSSRFSVNTNSSSERVVTCDKGRSV